MDASAGFTIGTASQKSQPPRLRNAFACLGPPGKYGPRPTVRRSARSDSQAPQPLVHINGVPSLPSQPTSVQGLSTSSVGPTYTVPYPQHPPVAAAAPPILPSMTPYLSAPLPQPQLYHHGLHPPSASVPLPPPLSYLPPPQYWAVGASNSVAPAGPMMHPMYPAATYSQAVPPLLHRAGPPVQAPLRTAVQDAASAMNGVDYDSDDVEDAGEDEFGDDEDDEDDDEEELRHRWECDLDEPLGWVPYEEHICNYLDAALGAGATALRFVSRGFVYELDLIRFMQINCQSGKERPLRRVTEVPVEALAHDMHCSAVVWPFADRSSSRLVHFSHPRRRVLEFEPFMRRMERNGVGRDLRKWAPRLYACEIGGRLSETGLALVKEGSSEWLAVQDKFCTFTTFDEGQRRVTSRHQAMADSVLSVFRIQSTEQMERYFLRRAAMSSGPAKPSNRGTGTEELLFHGPSSLKALEGIVSRGFDRMFAHKGVNAYGVGVYFASQALMGDKYSCVLYSEPDGCCCNAMILSKVIVGEYCQGSKGQYPPPLKPGSTACYDTTVDDPSHPTIFVTYQDNQAVPLYIITYISPFTCIYP